MRTVQMTLDDELVRAVDRAAKRLKTTRSAFTRRALREALSQMRIRQEEEHHRRGYERQPARNTEFSEWEDEQVWPQR